jgi:isopentenyl-diphosphate delta-isomerase
MEEKVVLVDANDNQVGLMKKLEAHQKGLLHRAISIMIFNDQGEILIQQRASSKYHWPEIWCNACCSHPRENETYIDAAHRRLNEELGIKSNLIEVFKFIYRDKDVVSGLVEHELDCVFKGIYNGDIIKNPDEVKDIKWISVENLKVDMVKNSQKYSYWFKHIFNQFLTRSLL